MTTFLTALALSIAFQAEDKPYRWTQHATDPARMYLYRGAVQIGAYDLGEHYYRPFDGLAWGEKTDPPLPPPCFGVAPGKLGGGPTYRLDGRPVPANVAYEAIEKGLDDDGRKLRVSIIGPTSLREKARADLERHPGFAGLRDKLAVRDFPPDHWALKAGFVTTGQPTIYCQAPDGTVLHRQDDYAGGADALVAALRKARDTYDPRRDPDLRSRFANVPRIATIAAAGIAGAVACAVVRRRRVG